MVKKKFWQWRLKPRPPWDRWSQRTYILPTKFGLYFGSAVVLMLFTALSYANNLVFFVCFFLASFGIIAMHMTNRNIKFFTITEATCMPFFADLRGEIQLQTRSLRSMDLFNIRIRAQSENPSRFEIIEQVDIKTGTIFNLPIQDFKRGWNSAPAFQVESDYPFRMCRSWKKIKFEAKFLVYPARVGSPQFPNLGDFGSKNVKPKKDQEEDFLGHKEYVANDPIRRIDWKASARSQKTLVKKFDTPSGENVIFHWDQTAHLHDFESRISQLALWIDLAERKRINYQLILPSWKSPLSKGPAQYNSCLQTLALAETTSVSA